MAAADVVGETVSTSRQRAEARGPVGDTAWRAEIVRDSITRMEVPGDEQVARILARTAEAPAMPMADPLFQRMLRHRIIFLGQQVDDEIANRICAELVMLAAEDRQRDISISINSPGGSA